MTSAAITMTAPEAASPVQMYRATYSPDDNKLRLYAVSRLDPETYKKVHDAGFRWAPKQALFVAPAWTPGREDVLLSLAGEIEDEDSTLAERQEARAERFTGYSGKSGRGRHCFTRSIKNVRTFAGVVSKKSKLICARLKRPSRSRRNI
ncbi:Putative plasmid protein [Escherichia coli]|uniref:Putative plasmid protein n=1 Tax=Escherichia coli TaxID=562 RepID=A0A6H0A728_ECOLX|nr:putative plasmid protein [Escherichia coli]